MGRTPLSSPRPMVLLAIAVIAAFAAVSVWNPRCARAAPFPVTFDFDTGNPPLSVSQGTPFNQTSNDISAYFSSPSDPAGFSVQSQGTTFLVLSQFSGKYLHDSKPTRDSLDMKFNVTLQNITITFTTFEYSGGPGDEPSNLTLTAFWDPSASYLPWQNTTYLPPVGFRMARGTWPVNDTYPQGTLTFNSTQPFNLVRLTLPFQGPGTAVDFSVDNVIVADTTVIPEFPTSSIVSVFLLVATLATLFAQRKLGKNLGNRSFL